MRKHTVAKMAVSGLFAAVILLATTFLHVHPVVGQGYIHLGDMFVYLAACFLPTPYAMLAAGIGGGLADVLSGHIPWMIPTLIIKAVSVPAFANKGKLLCKRNVLAVLLGGVICVVGYYLAEVVLYGSWVSPFLSVPMNLIQSAANGIGFLVMAPAMDRLRLRDQINRFYQ